jgi:arylformamidase
VEWIDISVPLKTGMVHWPGDPGVKIERVRDAEKGDRNTLSELCMGAHTGTHMDAPLHFIRGGAGIDQLPLDIAMGQARVIEIDDGESIKLEELQKHEIGRGERILLKTSNSSYAWQRSGFVEDFVYISLEAARSLVESGVSLIGVDYLSVGGYKREGSEVHKTLLEAGIWLIEGLDLSKASAGQYELVCLPLRIVDGDGAPARAIIRSAV